MLDLVKQGDAGTDARPKKAEQVEVGNVLVDAPRYHSNEELQEYLHGFVRRCGHVASLEHFGNSTLGTPLVRGVNKAQRYGERFKNLTLDSSVTDTLQL